MYCCARGKAPPHHLQVEARRRDDKTITLRPIRPTSYGTSSTRGHAPSQPRRWNLVELTKITRLANQLASNGVSIGCAALSGATNAPNRHQRRQVFEQMITTRPTRLASNGSCIRCAATPGATPQPATCGGNSSTRRQPRNQQIRLASNSSSI